MKTLTEFVAVTIKNAWKTQQELVAAGKTPEELPAAMGEALKLEGDKLKLLLEAVEVVGTRQEGLKRVVAIKLNEGEKAPAKAIAKGENHYVVEFFPVPEHLMSRGSGRDERGGRGRDGKRGGRDGKGRGGRGDKGRGGDRPNRGDRPDRGPRPEGAPAGGGEGRRFQPRAPRKPQEPRAPKPRPEDTFTGPRGVIVPRATPLEPTPAQAVQTPSTNDSSGTPPAAT